jgi:hypothetical protein
MRLIIPFFLLAFLPGCSVKNVNNSQILPGEIWNDTEGNPINAHGGGILLHEGTYYWYGEIKKGETWLVPDQGWECYRVKAGGVSCYSSKDLVNWKNEGVALAPNLTDSTSELHYTKVLERPKVIYNEKTKKFVMWLHVEAADYSLMHAGVAVSDTPEGPFTYIESVRPFNQTSADMTLFVDDDGKAYHIFAGENDNTLYVGLLDDTYLKHSKVFSRKFVNLRREAPAIMKHDKKYYLVTSGCTGWSSNIAEYAVADSILGEWQILGNPCVGEGSDITFEAQSTFLLPMTGESSNFIFLADKWNKTNLEDSRYVWLPGKFENGKMIIEWRKQWSPVAYQSKNQVSFVSADTLLKKLFDLAESKAAGNIRVYSPNYTVLVEGGEYPFVWIETQPMGGVMYAKRNLQVAHDNITIFLENQLKSGRFPGMIIPMNNNIWNLKDLVISDSGRLGVFSETLQGFFVPGPALELYYLLDRDTSYLNRISRAFEAYDAYLWKYRDSDGDGCLESWCQTDAGEDYLIRYDFAPFVWPFDYPPVKGNIPDDSLFMKKYWPASQYKDYTDDKNPIPVESIDIMCYSYTCRDVLAKISAIKKDSKEIFWRNKANEVLAKMKDYLWIPEKNAYFYRDKFNKIIPSLTHNNLRAMYFGAMTQEMANDFIAHHLLNPAEFWTTMPLPSIAANDPYFRNFSNNNWSGQPEGLTYQRAIKALENYGHYAEVTLLGNRLLKTVDHSRKFTQQFDPFTGSQNGLDGYGPTILAVLEYYSRMYGVYTENDTINFNGLSAEQSYSYTQKLNENYYKLVQENMQITAYLNEKEIFRATAGIKVMTDRKGIPIFIAGIDTVARNVKFQANGKSYNLRMEPNEVYQLYEGKWKLIKKQPFDYPFRKNNRL